MAMPQEEITRLDNIIMPFGKFQGTRMGMVPASYLDWLRSTNFNEENRWPKVAEYLEKMSKYIDLELEKNL